MISMSLITEFKSLLTMKATLYLLSACKSNACDR